MRITFGAGRSPHDMEKLVLPGVVWIRMPDQLGIVAYTLLLGWWDWSVHITAFRVPHCPHGQPIHDPCEDCERVMDDWMAELKGKPPTGISGEDDG